LEWSGRMREAHVVCPLGTHPKWPPMVVPCLQGKGVWWGKMVRERVQGL
jgi:hypothetical protein